MPIDVRTKAEWEQLNRFPDQIPDEDLIHQALRQYTAVAVELHDGCSWDGCTDARQVFEALRQAIARPTTKLRCPFWPYHASTPPAPSRCRATPDPSPG